MLRVDLEDFEGNTTYAEYNTFDVKSENDKYRLVRGSYSGNASSSLPHDRPFTTSDHDNDHHRNCNCTTAFKGAWWYSACHASNLNGLYLRGNHSSYAYGVNWKGWKGWKGYHYSLERTEMKIRPVNF
ncbi:techylectin-5B-like [Pocillopora verrucosa]|uniref:techylectin-5B-like n=1 Tax=Pocillopora verrucosa TaxID=203993 RepID=UPI00333E7CCC